MGLTRKYNFLILILILTFYFKFIFWESSLIYLEVVDGFEENWSPYRGYFLGDKIYANYFNGIKNNAVEGTFFSFGSLNELLLYLEEKKISLLDFSRSIKAYEISYVISKEDPLCCSTLKVYDTVVTKDYGIFIFKSNPEPSIWRLVDAMVYSTDNFFNGHDMLYTKCYFSEVDRFLLNLYKIDINVPLP